MVIASTRHPVDARNAARSHGAGRGPDRVRTGSGRSARDDRAGPAGPDHGSKGLGIDRALVRLESVEQPDVQDDSKAAPGAGDRADRQRASPTANTTPTPDAAARPRASSTARSATSRPTTS